jgi:predicted nucleic acid-binding protein
MLYLIDTNVLSEPSKPDPNREVIDWGEAQPRDSVAVSVISLGEVRFGIDLMHHGAQRAKLERWLKVSVLDYFHGRMLSVTKRVALKWAQLAAAEQKRGRRLPIADGLLLATAAVHGLTIVTRNERDFEDRGVPVYNPWRTAE